MPWNGEENGSHGRVVRCHLVHGLACVLVVATIGGCGTTPDDAVPTAPVSVAAISPADLSEPGPYGVGITALSLPKLSGVAYYPAAAQGSEAARGCRARLERCALSGCAWEPQHGVAFWGAPCIPRIRVSCAHVTTDY